MRILQLTPGTGDFHCGACLRDETLMLALRGMGEDVLIAPLYLPLVTEHESQDTDHKHAPSHDIAARDIHFGGINVYLEQKSALFRKLPRWLDGWLASRWLLQRITRFVGMTRTQDLGEMTISMLRGESGHQAREIDRLIHWIRNHHPPDVILLSNVLLIGMARQLRKAFACPVICTLQGEDGFLDALAPEESKEAWRTLAERADDVDAFIAVSDYYGKLMRERMNLPESRITVVPNGIALEGYDPAPRPPQRPTIGFLARLCAAKGLDTLAKAFVILKQRGRVPNAALRIAGACNRSDELYVDVIKGILREGGVLDDVQIERNLTLDQKQSFLRDLSLLSVPATYGESFGLYVIEALATGIPVVQPRHAAFEELITRTGGGILCEPDDPQALALAIESLLLDDARRTELATRGREVVQQQFTDRSMAQGVLDVINHVRTSPNAQASKSPEVSADTSHTSITQSLPAQDAMT